MPFPPKVKLSLFLVHPSPLPLALCIANMQILKIFASIRARLLLFLCVFLSDL
jgi:hypothetical protein